MSTRESERGKHGRGESISMNKATRPNAAYYVLLTDRIEALLRDLEATGASNDDDLVRRLKLLLAEARGQLPKKAI